MDCVLWWVQPPWDSLNGAELGFSLLLVEGRWNVTRITPVYWSFLATRHWILSKMERHRYCCCPPLPRRGNQASERLTALPKTTRWKNQDSPLASWPQSLCSSRLIYNCWKLGEELLRCPACYFREDRHMIWEKGLFLINETARAKPDTKWKPWVTFLLIDWMYACHPEQCLICSSTRYMRALVSGVRVTKPGDAGLNMWRS